MRRRLLIVCSLFVAAGAVAAAPALAGGGGHGCSEFLTDEAGTAVTLDLSCFMPSVLRVETGTTVRWTNKETVPHTVTGLGGEFGSHEGLEQNDFVTATFDEPGIFPYFCAYHPGMIGAVAVSETAGDDTSTDTGAAAAGTVDEGGAAPSAPTDSRRPWWIPIAVAALILTAAIIGSATARAGRPRIPA